MVTPKQWKEFNKHRDKVYKDVIESKEWEEVGNEIKSWQDLLKEREVKKIGFFGREYTETYTLSNVDAWYVSHSITLCLTGYQILLCKVPPKTVEACLDWLAKTIK